MVHLLSILLVLHLLAHHLLAFLLLRRNSGLRPLNRSLHSIELSESSGYWYKGNPDAQTNEAFRRAQKFPLRVTQGQRKHYTGRNYMTAKCVSGAQPRLWTDEEILAYHDFDERTEKQTEHSVMTEFAGNGNRFVNRGIGALLGIAAADIAKRAEGIVLEVCHRLLARRGSKECLIRAVCVPSCASVCDVDSSCLNLDLYLEV